MFIKAIETAQGFTRPIHSIVRFFGSADIYPGTATLFFVNKDGWALTCKHVALELAGAEQLSQKYEAFRKARASLRGQKNEKHLVRKLELTSGFKSGVPVEVMSNFVSCVEGPLNVEIQLHPSLDIALIHFTGFQKLGCSDFPIFAKYDANLKQGKFLCRLGFPFPEFTNYSYDSATDRIAWTHTGQERTPWFPIEAMVTRHLAAPSGIVGFEMSRPGLRGQSGGPAFDTDGRVWGMQSATGQLDLDFDVDTHVVRTGKKIHVKDYAFLQVGHCVHVSQLKDFMKTHNVDFQEG